jgi:hypothetical protein
VLNLSSIFFGTTIFEFFEGDNGEVYAHGPDRSLLYKSVDQGVTWTIVGGLSTDVLTFRRLGTQLVFFGRSQRDLYSRELSTGKYKQLDLTGLGQYGIQDIALYKDRVYIATWGGGLYSKPFANLFDPKP